MAENITLTGVLFLGGFVGLLLGLSLQLAENITLKAAIATIGGALSGTPIVFMRGLQHQKWMYPIGLVIGLLWVRVIRARTVIGQRPRRAERGAWYVAWVDTLAVIGVTVVIVIVTAFMNTGDHVETVVRVARTQMPCRWAWIYLGRYSNSRPGYEVPPTFKYAGKELALIPRAGDEIVLTTDRHLLISNYSQAAPGHKCDAMLEPPWGYVPDSEGQYIAGTLPIHTMVLVNQIVLMPDANADPKYVWALVGPE